ncbi:MAG: hypothetical protein M1816_006447 [Peltula sp. TS41687]|nr:MAG: hypothetical protein M1816_006447 [Peltula sp. TS41687]
MHPHLHTKDNTGCEEVMLALEECHARGFLHRVFGGCNEAKTRLNKCLRAERVERQTSNREKAKVNRERIQARWREIDENS